MNLDLQTLIQIARSLPLRKLPEALTLAMMIASERGDLTGPKRNATITKWLKAAIDLADDLTTEELSKLVTAVADAIAPPSPVASGFIVSGSSAPYWPNPEEALLHFATSDPGKRASVARDVTLSVLPIDAILNAYSLTVQLILAIREDMTPEQRKAGWLWLEKIQKQIEGAVTQS